MCDCKILIDGEAVDPAAEKLKARSRGLVLTGSRFDVTMEEKIRQQERETAEELKEFFNDRTMIKEDNIPDVKTYPDPQSYRELPPEILFPPAIKFKPGRRGFDAPREIDRG